MQRDAQRRLIAGKTGSGKSTLARQIAVTSRTVVCDPKGDWREDKRFTVIDTGYSGWPAQLLRHLKSRWARGFRVALIPGRHGSASGDLIKVCELIFELQRPYHLGQASKKITLIAEEMSFSYPAGNVGEIYKPVKAMVRMGRDYGVEMWGVTQGPGKVNLDYRDNVSEVYLFQLGLGAQRSRQAVADLLAPDAYERWSKLNEFEYVRATNHVWEVSKTKKKG